MLEITGATMSGIDAVEFLEMLPDNIPDEIKDDEFCAEYERMLNRVRAEVRKAVPLDAKVTEPKTSRFPRYYSCGKCLLTLRPEIDKYCPRCGRMIGWKSVLPERLV
jgi:hypothetical protein